MLDTVQVEMTDISSDLIIESMPDEDDNSSNISSEPKDFTPTYDIALKLFYKYFNEELNNIIYNSEKFGWNTLKASSLNAFIQELSSYIGPINSYEREDITLLHYICRAFNDYNDKYLNLKTNLLFTEKILYPNLVYIMIKFLYNGHKFLNKLIDSSFYNYKLRYSTVVSKFLNSYFFDEDLIKTTIFYKLLNDQMRKINPETVNNIYSFYRSVIFNRFSYFFRTEIQVNSVYNSLCDNDNYMTYSGLNTSSSSRLSMYKQILYNIKIEKMARKNPIQSQLSYNFDIFKRIIIPNEFQDVLYNTLINSKENNIDDDKFKIMNMYDNDSGKIVEILQTIKDELPLIYKLLKCVHLINNSTRSSSYNEHLIKKEDIKNNVYDELYTIFGGTYCNGYIRNILENIAENFTNNILSGEYINLLTLNSFKIYTISFKYQLRKFIKMCIEMYAMDVSENG